MPRKSRTIYEGAIYHIYQRGNNKEYIFQNDNIKSFLLKYLKEYNKKFDYEVLAYVIMNNHYHLLIKTNKVPIDKIMFYLNNLLGKYIKTQLDRTGHAFDGRYRSNLVDTDAYLIWLLRYIHRNQVKANICSRLDDYYWSSHYFYKNGINTFINTKFILDLLGNSKEAAIKRYVQVVNSAGDEADKEKDYLIIKDMFSLEEKVFSGCGGNIIETVKPKRKTMGEILEGLKISQEVIEDMKSASRKQGLTPLKIDFIKGDLNECYSLKEIATYLNAAPSTISKLITRNKIV